ncbi:MAG: iron chelate uptake ABC transporter family permease subunit [Vibrio sp.]|uniref:iron chelate uptake ABC transporter family permease subunit n=1 Tax=Vibrio sp. TaxID=678 RepID=UPI003A8506B4
MTDKQKLLTLIIISLVFIFLFISAGLTWDNYQYFLYRRTPKVLAIVVAGIAIGIASFSFQTITNNRILTPSIMGFDSLYLLIQSFIVVTVGGFSVWAINPFINFALSSLMMLGFSLILFALYFRYSSRNIISLLLLGVIFGQLFQSLSSFFMMLMDPDEFAIVQSNMFASFNNVNVGLVYWTVPVLILIAVALFRYHNILDVYLLDQDNCISLGVDVKRTTRNILLLSAGMVAISTALVGPLLFFGLLVTNLTREWLRTYQHRMLLTCCALMSVVALISGQWVVERLLGFQTTLSVVINFIGGVYFLYLLLRNKVV